jgi:8-oxo-dGTP diphosphatase
MTQYVLGFAFNQSKDFVVLILKNKPAWQKGCFNGIGGKREPDETFPQAMVREFKEETGLQTDINEWSAIGQMKGSDWECDLFTISDDSLMDARTMEEEDVHVLPVADVINGDYQTISNVPFLIELCRDEHRPKNTFIQY